MNSRRVCTSLSHAVPGPIRQVLWKALWENEFFPRESQFLHNWKNPALLRPDLFRAVR